MDGRASTELSPARVSSAVRMTLTSLADGVWLDTGPVNIVGMPLTSTMTVLRLADGSLLLHSPVAFTAERRAEVEALGLVTHLYAPNTFHHLSIGDWATAFPSARVHAPRGVTNKRRDLRIDRILGTEPEPAFSGVVDELPVEGFRMEENVVFHRPTRTLVVADLIHNVGRPEGAWTKFYTRTMGFYDRVALSKVLRWTAFSDRAAARRSLDALLELPFDRIVVGHGSPVTAGAKDALRAAFEWLPSAT